jgi:nucleoside-diphosphate-sugar epimerase
MKKVLVTGGTGFVGRQLLSGPRTWEAKVALRGRVPVEMGGGAEIASVGDINHQTDWSEALSGVDCVLHMAARVHVMHPTPDDDRLFNEVNVLGTERLALMAAENGVKRFVFLSSIKVNGEETNGKAYTATDAAAPTDPYGKSKWFGEQKVFEIARKFGMEAIVIRPPLVYGPGVRANFLRLLSWTHKQIPLPLGSVHNARSLVSIWNLCDLINTVIEAQSVSSCVLMVSDAVDLSTPDLIGRLARALGKSPRLWPVPIPLLKLAGVLTGKRAEVARLCGSLTVDISSTKRQLRWAPPVTIDEGLARTARWYLKEIARQRA